MAARKTNDKYGREVTRFDVQGGRNAPDLVRAREVLGYTYPIDQLPGARVTDALLVEIAAVLERHGYPPLQPGRDVERLAKTLYRFLYRPVVSE